MRLSSKELCRLLLYGHNDLSVIENTGVLKNIDGFL